MAQQKTFRTAFNGFNREDVVHYIEYMNAKHQSEINQLASEADSLRNQLAQAQEPAPEENLPSPELEALQARCAELEERCGILEQERDEAIAALNRANTEKAEALAAKALAESQRDAAAAQQSTMQCRVEQELEAYRRAERTERLARERADRVYHQVNGVLADATLKVDGAAQTIGALSGQVMEQLTQLRDAVSGSKQALQDAADTMYTLRPTAEE